MHNALYSFLLVCCVVVVDFDFSTAFGNCSYFKYIELQDACWGGWFVPLYVTDELADKLF